MKEKNCCFFGHRLINKTNELENCLYRTIEYLIVEEKVSIFLFGSKSHFDDLCYDLVSRLKEKFPHIKRVYVRAEYPNIDESYKAYLMQRYEETYYPEKMLGAGRAVYVERNFEMIDQSSFCVVYYDEGSIPSGRKSGTKIALEYAKKRGKKILLFP